MMQHLHAAASAKRLSALMTWGLLTSASMISGMHAAQAQDARPKALHIQIPSIPENAPQVDVVDNNLAVQLLDAQIPTQAALAQSAEGPAPVSNGQTVQMAPAEVKKPEPKILKIKPTSSEPEVVAKTEKKTPRKLIIGNAALQAKQQEIAAAPEASPASPEPTPLQIQVPPAMVQTSLQLAAVSAPAVVVATAPEVTQTQTKPFLNQFSMQQPAMIGGAPLTFPVALNQAAAAPALYNPSSAYEQNNEQAQALNASTAALNARNSKTQTLQLPASSEQYANLAPAAGGAQTAIAAPSLQPPVRSTIVIEEANGSQQNAAMVASAVSLTPPNTQINSAKTLPTLIAPPAPAPALSADAAQSLAALAPAAGGNPPQDMAGGNIAPVRSAMVIDEAGAPALAATALPAASQPPAASLLAANNQDALPSSSNRVLSKIPAKIDTPKKEAKQRIDISREHINPSVFSELDKGDTVATHESIGLKIEVKKSNVNVNTELEQAYNALAAGNSEMALENYKRVLSVDPNNTQALFGAGAILHRAGDLDGAKSYYARVLSREPENRDTLNNFLSLVADEAPQEALTKLKDLELKNPDFSPIPAQISYIYQKLGDIPLAGQYMLKALALAPNNLNYKYNLAILLDKQGARQDAADYYQQLVEAHLKGASIPGNFESIQERLTFLRSNRK